MSNRSDLLVPRPRRHTGRLAAVDATRSRGYPIVLGGPLQTRGYLFQDISVTLQHVVDDVHRR